jgi:hypothetical protein
MPQAMGSEAHFAQTPKNDKLKEYKAPDAGAHMTYSLPEGVLRVSLATNSLLTGGDDSSTGHWAG